MCCHYDIGIHLLHVPGDKRILTGYSLSPRAVALQELVADVGCQVVDCQLQLELNFVLYPLVELSQLVTESSAAPLDALLETDCSWPERGREGEGVKKANYE